MIGSFLFGVAVGVMGLYVFALYKLNSYSRRSDKVIDELRKDVDLALSVKQRFSRVSEITNEQMDLLASAERPSASAAHSKHQNGIVGKLKKLEEEKIAIFRSILKDGLDPKLSVVIAGKPTTMKMSEAVSLYDTHKEPSDIKTESKPSRKLRLVSDTEAPVDTH